MRYAIVALAAVVLAGANAGEVVAPEKPPAQRIAEREFPSVFQAWSAADNLKEDPAVTVARHDLVFHGERFFGLQWDAEHQGLATGFTPESLKQGLARRRDLMCRNPNQIMLMEIRYRDAWGDTPPADCPEEYKKNWRGFLPSGHTWWRRCADGTIVPGWEEGGFLQMDFTNPEYREQVASQCAAAVASGVVDGIMLDWWEDDADRLALVTAIRRRIGKDALILVNANDRTIPRTAPFVNGLYMECYRSRTEEEWQRIAATLAWAETNLRSPRINCLESWYHTSRADEHLMRAITTLSLTLSDGYCLFGDPNPLPTPDHLHDWYPFWERGLGKALGPGAARPDGARSREFSHGTAVYNPMGNQAVTIRFDEPRTSRATGQCTRIHTLAACDGDLYLKIGDAPQQETPKAHPP
jgi:hypothetical protein